MAWRVLARYKLGANATALVLLAAGSGLFAALLEAGFLWMRRGFDAVTAQILRHYPWPGNVRELENIIERATLLSKGEEITVTDLPGELHNGVDAGRTPSTPAGTTPSAATQW